MQQLKLSIPAFPFYCPVTGEQLLFEEDYHSSPATLFHYIDLEGGVLVAAQPEIEVLYNEALKEIKEGLYDGYEFKYDYSNEGKAFDILVHVKLKDYSNSVLFELCDAGYACGPVSSSVFIGIDMGYGKALDSGVLDQEAFDFCFSGFEDYESVLIDASEINPTRDGLALFMEDTMGCGGFYFISTEEAWKRLLPALVVLDYVNQDPASIPVPVFESLKKVYLDYFNAGIYEALPKDFTADLNAVLTDYKIVFFGKVTDLFEANSEFCTELLEEFEGNPVEDAEGFLRFLSSYSKY
ncbi:hypothetical protein [Flavobacterium aciduliphilum]|uniref:Uncharacterized protein n=1 Tax=Flavobacterium aciduliphilum TaxID=1101402 RepID=A0A328YUF2_9FLAO|nr:hypothetical protein [Flavobacterium aciduliphilum]RAR73696.1 hypothetical protein CLV55_10315 [Flavobacterium aciduliphilum]